MNLIDLSEEFQAVRDQSDSSYIVQVRQKIARTNMHIEFVSRILLDLQDENS